MTYKILVCGGRDFKDYSFLAQTLYNIFYMKNKTFDQIQIISGAARGADSLAVDYAKSWGINYVEYPADWENHGKAAGPIRNSKMLEEGKPDLVVAFPGGKGTAHMVKIAKEKGVEVIEINE